MILQEKDLKLGNMDITSLMGKEVEIIKEMEKYEIPLSGISETKRKVKGEMDTSYDIQV